MNAQAAQNADFYVATDGNDAWTGTLDSPNADGTDGPFATLARARDAVRELKQGDKSSDIVVQIRGGRYHLTETVVLGLEDSAEAGQTITYAAYPGEEPIFSSGVKIDGWRELERDVPEGLSHMAQPHVWVADVPADIGAFRTLYDGDRRLPRAQTDGFNPTTVRLRRTEPPPGEFKLGQGDMSDYEGALDPLRYVGFPDGALRNWDNLEDVELIIRFGYAMAILPLEFVDEEWHLAKTAAQSGYVLKAMGGGIDRGETIAAIENVPEALTHAGEWVLNSKEGKLYLWPLGEKPGDEIFAPSLMELVRVEGDVDVEGPTDTPVRGIVFDGLAFTQGDRYVVSDDYMSIQHDWAMIDQGHGLLRLRGAEDCRIENCRFFNSGGEAIRLDLHCQRIVVTKNELSHLGCSGILLLGYGPGTKDVNCHNVIENNHLHHLGEIFWHSHGIIVHQSSENLIAHNSIHNMPRKAICLCGVRPQFFIPEEAYNVLKMRECAPCIRWHEIEDPEAVQQDARDSKVRGVIDWPLVTQYLHTRDNVVEYNDVSRANQVFIDGASINISGAGENNVIRRNYVHHIFNPRIAGAIRIDDFQRKTTIAENVIYKTNSCGIIHRHETYVENNVICDVYPGCYIWIGQRPINGSRITGNVMLSTGAMKEPRRGYRYDGMFYSLAGRLIQDMDVWEHLGGMENTLVDGNVYFVQGVSEESAEVLEKLRALGYAENSIYADPLLEDWDNGDFRLKADSPALKMGIKSLDVRETGLTDDFPERLK